MNTMAEPFKKESDMSRETYELKENCFVLLTVEIISKNNTIIYDI